MAKSIRTIEWKEAREYFDADELHSLVRHQVRGELRGVTLKLIRDLFEEEAQALSGQPWSRKGEDGVYRGGSDHGRVRLQGQQIEVKRPRLRRGGKEMPLQSYAALQGYDLLDEEVQRKMLRGVSTREYGELLEELEGGLGLSKSLVSKAFARGSQKALDQINGRDLSSYGVFVTLMVDGQQFAGTRMVIALGITADSQKVVLGQREGHTENAEVVADLLQNLVDRKLTLSETFLAVIDGAKALRSALVRRWQGRVLIQRCQVHKKRNVLDKLPRHWHAEANRRINVAYTMAQYPEALKGLRDTVQWLHGINESAAASLEEGLEETLTVVRLGLPDILRRTFMSTNPLESVLDGVRSRTRRVKRWRKPSMVSRWIASALLLVEKRLRRINGHRSMALLIEALKRQGVSIAKEVG
jgi:transposase-like protein